jgi:hypothetical protein
VLALEDLPIGLVIEDDELIQSIVDVMRPRAMLF